MAQEEYDIITPPKHEVLGYATFYCTKEELNTLVHWVNNGNGFQRLHNPNGCDFFAGIYESDRKSAQIIDAIKGCVRSGNKGGAFGDLCKGLEARMPIIDGVRYAMTYEQAFYVEKTCRLMDDIYIIQDESTENHYDVRLVNYVTGEYAS